MEYSAVSGVSVVKSDGGAPWRVYDSLADHPDGTRRREISVSIDFGAAATRSSHRRPSSNRSAVVRACSTSILFPLVHLSHGHCPLDLRCLNHPWGGGTRLTLNACRIGSATSTETSSNLTAVRTCENTGVSTSMAVTIQCTSACPKLPKCVFRPSPYG